MAAASPMEEQLQVAAMAEDLWSPLARSSISHSCAPGQRRGAPWRRNLGRQPWQGIFRRRPWRGVSKWWQWRGAAGRPRSRSFRRRPWWGSTGRQPWQGKPSVVIREMAVEHHKGLRTATHKANGRDQRRRARRKALSCERYVAVGMPWCFNRIV
ncbi:unnamed protein product [Urochloa humidicola]